MFLISFWRHKEKEKEKEKGRVKEKIEKMSNLHPGIWDPCVTSRQLLIAYNVHVGKKKWRLGEG